MAFSLALVDFDGTLADSMPYWLRLPADTLRAAGLPQPEGFAEYIRSVPIREIARDMGAKYPQLEAETPLAVRWSAEMAAHYAREIPLKPGAKKLLQTLRAAGLRVYILSATRHALLDPAIERLIFEGVIGSEEMEKDIRNLTQKAFALPEVQDWYSGNWTLFNECTIIYKERGELQTRRPDRVMMREGQVVVVDFKFGKPNKKYNKQVKGYMNLLVRMGYEKEQINGYLWYVDEGKVEKVNKRIQ